MNRTSRKIFAILLATILCLVCFAACGETGEEQSNTSEVLTPGSAKAIYKIGLVQYMEHPALDSIRESFMNRLEEWGYDETKVSIDYQNAAGQESSIDTICQKFVTDEVDMIVAIATPTAKSAVTAVAETEIKVLFAAVNDPAAELGINNLEAPEGNITGTSDNIPVESIIDLAVQINPAIKTFGIMYNSGESSSAADAKKAKDYCEGKSITVVDGVVTDTAGLQGIAETLCTEADAIFVSADNSISSSVSVVADAAKAAKKPFYAGSSSMVEGGAFASIGVDYSELGAQNADMAIEIIEGRPINEIPVKVYTEYQTYINQATLDVLALQIPNEILEKAFFYQ